MARARAQRDLGRKRQAYRHLEPGLRLQSRVVQTCPARHQPLRARSTYPRPTCRSARPSPSSARFPVISPTGALRDCRSKAWTRVTDGGLFENFRCLHSRRRAALPLVLRTRGRPRRARYQAVPVAMLISSDPSLDRLSSTRRRPTYRRSHRTARAGRRRSQARTAGCIRATAGAECPASGEGTGAALFVDPVRAPV